MVRMGRLANLSSAETDILRDLSQTARHHPGPIGALF